MKRKIRVGLDFDGVVAYNPFRVVRAPIKWFKKRVLGIKKLTFFVPQGGWQKWMWIMVHESSVFPAKGCDLLRSMAEQEEVEFHLITGRYGFLKRRLLKWLESYRLVRVFKTININEEHEQPHLYKEKVITKLKLDIYVEDNLDIVEYLKGRRLVTQIWWIFNILDRRRAYVQKFPRLEEALREIARRK